MITHSELSNEDLSVAVSDDELEIRATIDRPDQRNALNDAVINGLTATLEYADNSPIRTVVIRGANGTFCSGGDINSMAISAGEDSMAYRDGFDGMKQLIEACVNASAITIAAVEGYCLAGGMGLAAACDVILATADTTFGTPEVDIGIFPAQALVPIMRTVNEKQALKYLFTGEQFDAQVAQDIGFVTDVISPDTFEENVDDTVDALVTTSPAAITLGKESFYNQREMGFHEALEYMHEIVTMLAMSDDAEAGINAFINDSTPNWKVRE